jgi:cell division protein FtsB
MFEAKSAIVIKRLLVLLVLGAVVATITARVVDPARAARHEMLDRQHARVITLNARLARDNERLETDLAALERGEEGWKVVARRDHGMILPGEVIFRFPLRDR